LWNLLKLDHDGLATFKSRELKSKVGEHLQFNTIFQIAWHELNCLSSKKKDEGLDHISRWSNNLNMLLCFLNGKVKVWFWDLLACRDDLTRDMFVKTLCPRIGNRKFIDAMKEFDKLHKRTMWRSIMSSLSEELRAAVLEHICFYA
jgi:hypothetical protein